MQTLTDEQRADLATTLNGIAPVYGLPGMFSVAKTTEPGLGGQPYDIYFTLPLGRAMVVSYELPYLAPGPARDACRIRGLVPRAGPRVLIGLEERADLHQPARWDERHQPRRRQISSIAALGARRRTQAPSTSARAVRVQLPGRLLIGTRAFGGCARLSAEGRWTLCVNAG